MNIHKPLIVKHITKLLIKLYLKMSLKKTKELNNINYQDYSKCIAILAQSVVQQVCDEYNYYFKAL